MTTTTRPRLDSAPNRPYILSPIDVEDTDRQAWLAVRRRGIGSSDAAKILGLSRWGNPLTVFMDKTQEWSDDSNEAADMGNELEATVAGIYARKTGVSLLGKVGTLEHPDLPWMLASPDFLTDGGDPPMVEVKCRSDRMAELWAEDGDTITVPDEVEVQVQHQLAVTGFASADVVAMFGGNRIRWGRIPRDDVFIADLVAAEEAFWTGHVLAGVPPAPDGMGAETDMLNALWRPDKDTEERINLDPSARLDLQLIADCKVEVKALSAVQDAAENRIKVAMGVGTHGYISDELVLRWKEITSKRVQTKELRAAHPAITAEFTEESHYRRFDPAYPPKKKPQRDGDE